LAWLSQILASSATIAKSHACISSKPPAIAQPRTTAITATGTVAIASHAAAKASNSSRVASRSRSSCNCL
jgi:hypothetical protein